MITSLTLLLSISVQQATPRPANPGSAGAAPLATSAVSVRVLDTKAFAREIDALGDVRPVMRTVLRSDASIDSVSVDISVVGGAVRIRPVGNSLELVAMQPSGTELLLGAFRWETQQLSWSWSRVSTTSHGKELDALAAGLATCSIDIHMSSGSLVRLQPPASNVRVVLQPGSVSRVSAPVPAGKRPLLLVADAPGWSRDESDGRVVLTCDKGDLVVAWDDETRECTIEWVSARVIELEVLRKDILARKKELSQRNSSERAIIEREIQQFEARIKDLEMQLGTNDAPPSIPQVTLRSESGREFAVIRATIKKVSQ